MAQRIWRVCGRFTPSVKVDLPVLSTIKNRLCEPVFLRSLGSPQIHLGAKRIAPSSLITSPFNMSLVMIWCTSLA
jgi:hypothetical protein